MKAKKILLFVIGLLICLPIENAYAASYTVDNAKDVGELSDIPGKRAIYIADMTNYDVHIYDTNFATADNPVFDTITEANGGKPVSVVYLDANKQGIKRGETFNKTYKNKESGKPLFNLVFKNAGYYIKDDGVRQNVNISIDIMQIDLHIPADAYAVTTPKYIEVWEISYINNTWAAIETFDKDWERIIRNNDEKTFGGAHMIIDFTVTKSDGKPIDSDIANGNLMIPWKISDLDIPDRTSPIKDDEGYSWQYGGTYTESIQFDSGFDNITYVNKDNSLLVVSNNGSKYRASGSTNENNEEIVKRSTVVAYQTSPKVTVEWWGSECHTALQVRTGKYDYPYMTDPEKSANGSSNVYRVGDTVSYTISQKFPYTITGNAASGIIVKDTFDKVLDISNITYVVKKGNTNESEKWTISKNEQTVTLTYAPKEITDSTNVTGDYTFTFKNIKAKEPDDSYQSINIKDFK